MQRGFHASTSTLGCSSGFVARAQPTSGAEPRQRAGGPRPAPTSGRTRAHPPTYPPSPAQWPGLPPPHPRCPNTPPHRKHRSRSRRCRQAPALPPQRPPRVLLPPRTLPARPRAPPPPLLPLQEGRPAPPPRCRWQTWPPALAARVPCSCRGAASLGKAVRGVRKLVRGHESQWRQGMQAATAEAAWCAQVQQWSCS